MILKLFVGCVKLLRLHVFGIHIIVVVVVDDVDIVLMCSPFNFYIVSVYVRSMMMMIMLSFVIRFEIYAKRASVKKLFGMSNVKMNERMHRNGFESKNCVQLPSNDVLHI